MLQSPLLKFKSKCFIFILGILNLFAFSFIFGCSGQKNNTKDNTADSIARVNKMKDSLANEKHKKDSLAEIKRINDSIILADSLNKIKPIKIKYKPVHPTMKYGVVPTGYKK
jgi:hypothetical protein